jgi:carbonic anhydrase/acetyltransferase-like protein (isoleucine patch superfamily)
MIHSFESHFPDIHATAFVHETAFVNGRVTIGAGASIWPMVVVRGDINDIRIGARSNIQDGSVLHVTHDSRFSNPGGESLTIGEDVTVGHNVTLHGCTLQDRCLIGMGAIVLDGATIESDVMVGAGALVPPFKTLESGYLYVGNPARRTRALKEQELEFLNYSAEHYVKLARRTTDSTQD